MRITNLPCGVQDFLARCPKAGDGVNRWIFSAARLLHRANVLESEIPALISAATKNCGRVVTAQEIERAVVNSGRSLKNGFQAERRTPRWPQANQEQIEAVVRNGARLDDLKRMSPVKWSDSKAHTEEVIDLLFPGNPLLCVGLSKFSFNTVPRQTWRGRLAARQFIVPSPMSKAVGTTKDGRASKHTLDNTGPRRFLVIEFDKGSFDQHAAILRHLAQFAPLVMVVYSGSKSLHGWFYVEGQPDMNVEKFFRYAVSLGADPQLWIRSQFCRLPDGRRDNGKRQEVVYFNPSRIKDND
jgi:hypothetical protein